MSSQSSNLLAPSDLLDQPSLNDDVIAIPIHFININEDVQANSLSESSAVRQSISNGRNFTFEKPNIHNVTNEDEFLQNHINNLVKHNGSSEMKNLITSANISEIVHESNINEDNPTSSVHSAVSDTEDSLDESQILLHIGNDDVTEEFNLNQNQNECLVAPNLLLNSSNFNATGKSFEGRTFATMGFVDGQMVLTHADSRLENALTVDASSLNNDHNFLSGQLMVTKMLKDDNTIHLSDQISDSQVITIGKGIQDGFDPPHGPGPWTCKRCGTSFTKWSAFKKHERKHEEEKPYECMFCPESFNVEKNLLLHLSLHGTDGNICSDCGKEFRRIASLKAHLMIHQEDEIVTCNECNEEFFSLNQLHSHVCGDAVKVKIKSEGLTSSAVAKEPKTNLPTSDSTACDPLLIDPENIKKEPKMEIFPTFTCKKCGSSFCSALALKNHTLVHKQMRKLISGRPRRKFADRSMFDQKCPHCGKNFLKPSQLIRHLRIHTGEKPYKCTHPGCGRAFSQKGTLLIHKSIHSGEKAHVCGFCNKAFVQKSNLRSHMKRVHPSNNGNEPRLQCDECPCVFKKANSLNAHISKVHGAETIVTTTDSDDIEVGVIIKQLEEISKNRKLNGNVDSVIVETIDGDNATDVRLVKTENETSESPSSKGEPNNLNDILQEALKNSGLAPPKDSAGHEWRLDKFTPSPGTQKKVHVKLSHVVDKTADGPIRRYPVLVRIQEDNRWYVCAFEHCRKEFKKPSDLVRHIRVHTQERPFKCSLCSRAFSIKATLTSHFLTHTMEKKFTCEKCNKRFLTKASLKAHIMCHTGAKPYQCTKCSKSFRTVSHQKTHLLTHSQSAHRAHTLRKKAMPLPDIPLEEPILITSQGLVKQVARHSHIYQAAGASDPSRPHKCRYCPAAFKKSCHAKQHERTHTGERPYKCEHCTKSFNSLSVLRSHRNTHDNIRPFKCNTCSKLFASFGSLKRHLTSHSSDRPYMCPYCYKTFKTSPSCKKHMKTHKQELAMDAVRAAGPNLQGDSEQALLTAGWYKDPPVPVVLSLTSQEDGSDAMKETFLNPDSLSLQRENENIFAEENDQALISIDEPPSQMGPAEPLTPIQATLTSDLVSEGVSLENLQKEQTITGDIELTSRAETLDQPRIFFATDKSSIQKDPKIYVSSMPKEAPPRTDPFNAILMQPGAIFGPTKNSSHYIISAPLHKMDGESVELSINEPFGSCDQPPSAPLPSTPPPSSMPSLMPNASQKFNIIQLSSESDIDNVNASSSTLGEENSINTTHTTVIESTHAEHIEANVTNPDSLKHDLHIMSDDVMLPEEARSSSNEIIFFNTFKGTNEVITITPSATGGEMRLMNTADSAQNNEEEDLAESSPKRPTEELPNMPQEEETSDIVSFPHRRGNRRSSSNFQCNRCRKSFRNANAFRNHMKFHRKPRQCKRCGGSIPHKSLKEHNREQHTYKTCKLCNRTFCGEERLMMHIRDAHKEIKEGQEKLLIGAADKNVWCCPVCKTFFASSDAIQRHLPIHSQGEISAGMNKDLFEQTVWAMSTNRSKRKLELPSHALDALTSEYESSNPQENKLEISQPLQRGITSAANCQSNEFRSVCDICSKGFKKPSDLIRHTRTHTGEKPFSCQLCQKKFAVNSTLLVHMRTHSGRKEFQCPTCNIMYSSKGSLKIHMRLHTGAKPLKCQFCGLKFRTSGHRKAHIAKHFRVNSFKELDILKKVLTQHGETDRPASRSEASDKVEVTNASVFPPSSEPNDIYSLAINPDGTVTIHFSKVMNMNEEQNVNLPNVDFEDNLIDQLNYGNPVTLEFAEGSNENSISVDPNSLIATQMEMQPQSPISEKGPNQTDNHYATEITEPNISIVNLSDFLNINANNYFECVLCSQSFAKFCEWQTHLSEHQIVVQDGESSIQETSASSRNVDNFERIESSSLSKTISNVERNRLERVKANSFNCTFYNCNCKFYSEKDLHHHMDMAHGVRYQCSQCGEYFGSFPELENHIDSSCSGEKGSKRERGDNLSISTSDVLHINSSNKLGISLEEPRGCLSQVSKTEPIDEDFEPLMKDIFLAQYPIKNHKTDLDP